MTHSAESESRDVIALALLKRNEPQVEPTVEAARDFWGDDAQAVLDGLTEAGFAVLHVTITNVVPSTNGTPLTTYTGPRKGNA